MKKIILSISGGGIRGVIPACVLVSLEHYTGSLTRDVVSFCGGTSTGALLTAAVAAGVPASQSLDVYLNHGEKIFSPTNSVLRNFDLVTRGRMFDNKVLYGVVFDTLSSGSPGYPQIWRINDSGLPILITGCDQNGDTQYFTQDRGTNACQYGRYHMLEAAVASACATTYHDPFMVPDLGFIADGGVGGVADPSYQVAVESLYSPKCYGSIFPAEAILLSLGTGYYKPPKMPDPPGTLLDRISWVTSALVGSSETIAEQTVKRNWPGLLQSINAPLPSSIDEADVSAIPLLLKTGQALAASIDWSKII